MPIILSTLTHRFRCETDCKAHPNACVNEQLFIEMIDRMAEDGWRELGYEVGNRPLCEMSSTSASTTAG